MVFEFVWGMGRFEQEAREVWVKEEQIGSEMGLEDTGVGIEAEQSGAHFLHIVRW